MDKKEYDRIFAYYVSRAVVRESEKTQNVKFFRVMLVVAALFALILVLEYI